MTDRKQGVNKSSQETPAYKEAMEALQQAKLAIQ